MTTYNNYAEVQAGLSAFVKKAGVNIQDAPHHEFWQTMSYTDFTTGNIPGVPDGPNGPWKVLVCGHSDQSNIVQILQGVGPARQRFGRMPRPRPPYDPEQSDTITALAAWIDGGCLNPSSGGSNEGGGDENGAAEEGVE